jgi:L-threonylcarbamoyladenylate synthase
MPDCAPALALIAAAGGAVAATSANLSSEPPAQSGDEALRLFNNRVAVVLDGGTAAGGVPSTIIDCSTEPFTVVREGPISAETIFATLTQETATERGSRPANL